MASYTAKQYQPGPAVTTLHNFPHYASSDFSLSNDYLMSPAAAFILTCGGGILLLIIQWFFFCFEACCGCCAKCTPCGPKALRIILIVMLLLMLLGAGLEYWGWQQFQDGAAGAGRNLDALKGTFGSLNAVVVDISALATTMVTAANAVGCSQQSLNSNLVDAATGLKTASGTAVGLLAGFPDKIGSASAIFKDQAPLYINIGIGFITGLLVLVVFVGFLSEICSVTCCQNFTIVLATLVLLIFCPLVAFEVTISIFLADFCAGLANNESSITTLVKEYVSAAAGFVTYYTTCQGTNPITKAIDDTNSALTTLVNSLNTMKNSPAGCSSTQLDIMTASITSMQTDLSSSGQYLDCKAINPVYAGLMHDVTCNSVVEGLYRLWVVQVAIGFGLWWTLFYIQAEGEKKAKVAKDAKESDERAASLDRAPGEGEL